MRIGLFVYNPMSGNQAIPGMLDMILDHAMQNGLQLIPFRLHTAQESKALLTQLIKAPWTEFVIAAGGDGTLNSIAQEILTTRPELPMGIVPTGTCNDFAESLQLPTSIWDCINVVADNHFESIDVGCVNGERIFLGTCAAGIFVKTTYTVSSALKKSLGPLAYYFSALGELATIRSFPLTIQTETETEQDNYLLFLLLNGTQAGGLANLISKAMMQDGLMDLLLIRDVPPIELPVLFRELLNRENIDNGRWFKRIKAKRFRFDGPGDIVTTQDGEEGLPLPLEVEVLPRSLTVYIRSQG